MPVLAYSYVSDYMTYAGLHELQYSWKDSDKTAETQMTNDPSTSDWLVYSTRPITLIIWTRDLDLEEDNEEQWF
jgi:hypothetical protein